jgi:photosystem II stability/assembly factor-like uncharacterized protein
MHSIASGYRLSYRMAICISTLCPLAAGQWTPAESSATKAGLRGVHNAGRGIIWASGTDGTVLRSEDDGFVWQQCALPAVARKLDFRGVWAWDANHAIVMSSGIGDASRLYETLDGGASWRLLLANPDPSGFWDGIRFSGRDGILVGDPVDGRFTIFLTKDLGQHWKRETSNELAADPKREGVFAASNSSVTARQRGGSFEFVTGGLGGSRFFGLNRYLLISGTNQFETYRWISTAIPLAGPSESSGAFSMAFRTPLIGVVVGGDYKQPTKTERTATFTLDGGSHWTASTQPPSGFRSAVQWEPTFQCWIAVGPSGSDVSLDDGKTWRPFDDGNWNALSLPWVVGPNGRIARLDEHALKALTEKK